MPKWYKFFRRLCVGNDSETKLSGKATEKLNVSKGADIFALNSLEWFQTKNDCLKTNFYKTFLHIEKSRKLAFYSEFDQNQIKAKKFFINFRKKFAAGAAETAFYVLRKVFRAKMRENVKIYEIFRTLSKTLRPVLSNLYFNISKEACREKTLKEKFFIFRELSNAFVDFGTWRSGRLDKTAFCLRSAFFWEDTFEYRISFKLSVQKFRLSQKKFRQDCQNCIACV